MKWASGLVMMCVACGSATPRVVVLPPDKHDQKTLETAQQFVAAASKHDVAAVRSMLGDPVSYGGLWFSDLACRTEFQETGDVTGPRLDVLARCLAALDLRASPRRDALRDVAVLAYGAGFEIEARFPESDGAQTLSWIGYAARLEGERAPTISASALEAFRTAGDRDGPVAGLDSATKPHAWLKVCVDALGAVTAAEVRETTSTAAAKAFVAATRAWRFRPFVLEGQPVSVCAMFAMKSPAIHLSDEQEILPLPLPLRPDQVLVPQNELHLITGDKAIIPDDETMDLISRIHESLLIGGFKLCLDTTGHVSDVVTLMSTRSTKYDAKIISQMRSWTYEPAIIDGRPANVCTQITFIYSQH